MTGKIRRSFSMHALAVALAALVALPAGLGAARDAAAQTTELRLSTFVPPTHVIVREMINPWIEAVAKETNGEVKITVYPSMQLGGSPPGLFRQAVEGVVDLVFTLPGYTSPAFPRSQMIELPGLKPDGLAATNLMWDLMDPYLLPEYKGVKVIALWGAEDAGLMTRAKPIRSMDDVKGMRMRSPSAAQAKQLERMGATPTAMPITQVYQGLERGVIEGAMVPFTTILDFRLGEVARHYTVTGPIFGRSLFLIAMNQRKFDSLPQRHREAIAKLSGREFSLKGTQAYLDRAKEALDSVRGKAEIINFSDAEQKRILDHLRPIYDEWIEEAEGKGIPARDMLRAAGRPAGQ
jgi:TRAP-type C4-dicarboxylate transport system substrate-binding protein